MISSGNWVIYHVKIRVFLQRNLIQYSRNRHTTVCVIQSKWIFSDRIWRAVHPTIAYSVFSVCFLPISQWDIFKTNPQIHSTLWRKTCHSQLKLVYFVNLSLIQHRQLPCQALAAFGRVEGGLTVYLQLLIAGNEMPSGADQQTSFWQTHRRRQHQASGALAGNIF